MLKFRNQTVKNLCKERGFKYKDAWRRVEEMEPTMKNLFYEEIVAHALYDLYIISEEERDMAINEIKMAEEKAINDQPIKRMKKGR